MIKSNNIFAFILILLTTFLTSCAAVEGIFKAGMGVGIFVVVAIVVLVLFLFNKMRKKG